mgnify:CR=1 FL=1
MIYSSDQIINKLRTWDLPRDLAADPFDFDPVPRQVDGLRDIDPLQRHFLLDQAFEPLGARRLWVERGAADIFLDDARLLFVGIVEKPRIC